MRPQKQLFQHAPEIGVYGDCHRTALACLLDVDLLEIPHEHKDFQTAMEFPHNKWLEDRGLMLATLSVPGNTMSMQDLLDALRTRYPGIHMIFSGRSIRNVNHCVIVRDGRVVWDPHPIESPLCMPCDDGYWHVEFVALRT
jgi:hypothetical protein